MWLFRGNISYFFIFCFLDLTLVFCLLFLQHHERWQDLLLGPGHWAAIAGHAAIHREIIHPHIFTAPTSFLHFSVRRVCDLGFQETRNFLNAFLLL